MFWIAAMRIFATIAESRNDRTVYPRHNYENDVNDGHEVRYEPEQATDNAHTAPFEETGLRAAPVRYGAPNECD